MTGKRVKTNAHDNVWWSCMPVIEYHVHLAFDVVGVQSVAESQQQQQLALFNFLSQKIKGTDNLFFLKNMKDSRESSSDRS